MLTSHRIVLSVCVSIDVGALLLNHVVSDLVGLLTHIVLSFVHCLQSLNLYKVINDLQ